ncbi:proline-rich protein 29 isoform X2 [Caretta caretta]|nr:uncharacterized protein LOC125626621 isoform X2 [Caretta caretta]
MTVFQQIPGILSPFTQPVRPGHVREGARGTCRILPRSCLRSDRVHDDTKCPNASGDHEQHDDGRTDILWIQPSSRCCPEPSSTRQEEEESGSEGAEEEGNSPASLGACSQELFSSQEEGSQSQRPVLEEGQTPEDMPDATLRSQPSLLSTAERLQRIRKRPRRRKEDMLHEVMQQSLNENQKAQEWQESERRVRRQNADRQHQSTEHLLSIMERQADSIQALVAMQAKHYRTPAHSPCPKTLSLVPPYHLQPTFPNIWVLIATSCFQHLELHHPALQTTTSTHRAQPPSPCSRASPHCTALQTGRLSMRTGHTQICD